MMISTKGRYALRVMLDMAEHGGSEWHRLSDVAQRQQLSKKYLETIMAALSRANLVESAVGKSGGYRLTRSPEDYPVGAILRGFLRLRRAAFLAGAGRPDQQLCRQSYAGAIHASQ